MAVIYSKTLLQGLVSQQNGNLGTETQQVISLGEAVLTGPKPANVGVKLGYTKSLGNYESLRIDVSLNLPVENTPVEIEKAFAAAFEWVDAKVKQIVEGT